MPGVKTSFSKARSLRARKHLPTSPKRPESKSARLGYHAHGMTTTTMATGNGDNDVDGDDAMGNEDDDDGNDHNRMTTTMI